MLEEIVKSFQDAFFEGSDYCFQQDSAPAHKAKEVQQWQMEKVPDFITTNKWPTGSSDLSPLDYLLWNHLQKITCAHRNFFKSSLSFFKMFHEISQVFAKLSLTLLHISTSITQNSSKFFRNFLVTSLSKFLAKYYQIINFFFFNFLKVNFDIW